MEAKRQLAACVVILSLVSGCVHFAIPAAIGEGYSLYKMFSLEDRLNKLEKDNEEK